MKKFEIIFIAAIALFLCLSGIRDVNDDYLMKNEFMAYILQQPVSGCGQYFVNHAWWNTVMAFTPTLANYVINTKGKGFEDAAIALNDFVFDKYGLVAGNIALVQRP